MPDEIKAQNLTKNPQAGQPGEKPNLAGRLALVILVLAALAVAGYFGLKDGRDQQAGKQTDNKNVAAQNKPKQEAPKPADLEAQALIGNTKLEETKVAPKVEKELPKENIPATLKPFVLEGATEVEIKSATFNGKSGVLLTYKLPNTDVRKTINTLGTRVESTWQRLAQSRTDNSALLEIQKNGENIQAVVKDDGKGGVLVEIKNYK